MTLLKHFLDFILFILQCLFGFWTHLHGNSEVNTDMDVSPGIKHIDMILAKYPDVIAQLIARVEALESAMNTSTGEG